MIAARSVIGSELVQKYVGEGARMVRELFQMARSKKACIVFIDEVDAIGGTRFDDGAGGDNEVRTRPTIGGVTDEVCNRRGADPPHDRSCGRHAAREACLLHTLIARRLHARGHTYSTLIARGHTSPRAGSHLFHAYCTGTRLRALVATGATHDA